MILVVGGAFQGKHEFAKEMWPNSTVYELEDYSGEFLPEKECENKRDAFKEGVYVSSLIGCGIVPLSEPERKYRELIGSLQTYAAKCANEVYLVTAGIGQRIK